MLNKFKPQIVWLKFYPIGYLCSFWQLIAVMLRLAVSTKEIIGVYATLNWQVNSRSKDHSSAAVDLEITFKDRAADADPCRRFIFIGKGIRLMHDLNMGGQSTKFSIVHLLFPLFLYCNCKSSDSPSNLWFGNNTWVLRKFWMCMMAGLSSCWFTSTTGINTLMIWSISSCPFWF